MVKVLNVLNSRGIYHATVFNYGVMHNHAPAIRQFLLMQEGFLNGCGKYLKSGLVTIDPIQRWAYQHLEYKPLINNRAHRVGATHRILNVRIRGQYQQFLQIQSEKAAFDDIDQMSTAYYLFLQAQADEISGQAPEVNDDESRDQQQAALAAKEPALGMKVDGKRTHKFQLPRDYQAKNVLVEVGGGGKKRSQAVYANEFQTIVSENFGILTVRHDKDARPLSKVYVKVYVMTGSGAKFYKDGYTDLRGKFDYATVSTTDIGNATKFSVLVMSEEHGATVLEAPVPQR